MRPILLLPGYSGSGPDHWQSHWERAYPAARRVEQRDWLDPIPDEWVDSLAGAVAASPAPPVLVAHSLGCLTVVRWALSLRGEAHGALLVAPPDVEQEGTLEVLRRFAPVPEGRLPFPSIVVASSDDPYASERRSREFARWWGSRFERLDRAGHINSASGFGSWPEGERCLARLLRDSPAD